MIAMRPQKFALSFVREKKTYILERTITITSRLFSLGRLLMRFACHFGCVYNVSSRIVSNSLHSLFSRRRLVSLFSSFLFFFLFFSSKNRQWVHLHSWVALESWRVCDHDDCLPRLCCFCSSLIRSSLVDSLPLGPMEHLKGMCARDRIVFTVIYVGSMFMTLYFTFQFGGVSGYALVLSASAAQLLALLWYLVSFLPGGSAALHFLVATLGHLLKPVIVMCARFQAACIGRCISMWARS